MLFPKRTANLASGSRTCSNLVNSARHTSQSERSSDKDLTRSSRVSTLRTHCSERRQNLGEIDLLLLWHLGLLGQQAGLDAGRDLAPSRILIYTPEASKSF